MYLPGPASFTKLSSIAFGPMKVTLLNTGLVMGASLVPSFQLSDSKPLEFEVSAIRESRMLRQNCTFPQNPLSVSKSSSHRSEEHTSELQSRQYLVCRLLLEKKKI